MPYIEKTARDEIDANPLVCRNAGELNYFFTRFCGTRGTFTTGQIHKVLDAYVNRHGLNYQTINDILGAVTGCTYEADRRYNLWNKLSTLNTIVFRWYNEVAGPYEDRKIEENGDIEW